MKQDSKKPKASTFRPDQLDKMSLLASATVRQHCAPVVEPTVPPAIRRRRAQLMRDMPGDDQDLRKQEYAEEVENGNHDGC